MIESLTADNLCQGRAIPAQPKLPKSTKQTRQTRLTQFHFVGGVDESPDFTTSRLHHLTAFKFSNGLWEFPVGVLEIGRWSIPWGGGAYFRLLPYWLFRLGLRRIQNNGTGCYVFYLHPWELDPDQPRVKGLRWDYRLRHYWGLSKNKLRRLLSDFTFTPIKPALISTS